MYIIHSVNYICLLFYKASTQQVAYPYKNAGCYYLLSSSVACVPFLINMSNLNLSTRFLSSFIRMHRPIRVAKEQCGTVGLNSMRTTCTSPPVDGFIWTNRRHLITTLSTAFGAYLLQKQTKMSEMLLLFQAILNTEKAAYKFQKLAAYLWWI